MNQLTGLRQKIERARTADRKARGVSKPFDARFPGKCAHCTYGIIKGERVMFDGVSLIHLGCAK